MEKLKSMIPESVKRLVGESTSDDLPRTCSSLLDFFNHFEPFHQVVSDLADPRNALCSKSKEAALESKQTGNKFFLKGDYKNALASYSQALRVAPIEAQDRDKNLVATLYINRATVFHKINLMKECLRDCTRALQIRPSYAKAWYRRGKANFSLGNFGDAVRDLKVAKSLESSSGGKKHIEGELKTSLDQCNNKQGSLVQHSHNNMDTVDELLQTKLQSVTTPDKGRGMASKSDLLPASLVHIEEPYAVVISKESRETHCHYCLNELPADEVPCQSCSISLYCSNKCQLRAVGEVFRIEMQDCGALENLSSDLGEYVAEITFCNDYEEYIQGIPEHKHECGGVHWPAVLPSDIVLAGRVLITSVRRKGTSNYVSDNLETLELSHCYTKISSENKLELHIYATVLLYCLWHSYGTELLVNGDFVSQVVILLSQIRVNCITIHRMKSVDAHEHQDQFEDISSSGSALTSYVERVRVGKAIYRAGSLFNHSCKPNVHAYFLSRTLYIRTTKFVAAGDPLELSYGPQVGQWACKDRRSFLEDEYLFQCRCSGCTEVHLSDLVLNAFHCDDPNCSGIVLESDVADCENQKIKELASATKVSENNEVYGLSLLAFDRSNGCLQIKPGYCLKCYSFCDLESSRATANNLWISIKRLQDLIASKEISSDVISDALTSLAQLRLVLHSYNKLIAVAEDTLAQGFCLMGEFQRAMDHCKRSIQILEKLYYANDIVIAYELVKLCSIQLLLGDSYAVESINRMECIFSCFYGTHADFVFPSLQSLRRATQSTDQKGPPLISRPTL